ncbi:MAG: 6-pyruvoyl-tetrahydropterin synthase-related protein [Candidatus Beckwithbacteria bacterium]
MKFKKIIYPLLIISLILPSIWPLFNQKFFQMHDYTHIARLAELDRALKDGHFPPTWSKNLGWGYGMPLFHFYAPLPYYLAEGFHLIGFNYLNSIKIVFGLTFLLAFGGMYLLAKKFFENKGGLLAALALVYSPYRAVDFYARGALGELMTISLIPFVLWSLFKLIDEKKQVFKKVSIVSFLLGIFLLSHTILDLIALPLFILIAGFYLLIAKSHLKKYFYVLLSFILGTGLASFFVLPAFLEKKFTGVDKLTDGFSHYSHHFLYFRQFWDGIWGYGGSIDGINDGLSFHLGKVHFLLALITLLLMGVYWLKKRKFDKRIGVVGLFLGLTSFLAWLSTYHAKFIWDQIPIMAYIQFPWRFNSILIVLISFITGGSLYYLSKFFNKKISLIGLIIFGGILILINIKYFKPKEYVDENSFYYSDKSLISEQMSGVIPDFIPKWVNPQPKEMALTEYKILAGKPKIEVIDSKTQLVKIRVESDEDFVLQINRFYFPGWRLYNNGNEIEFKYENNNGIINLNLPKGGYELSLIYKNTSVRNLANLISLTSLLIMGILIFKKRV